MGAQQSKPWPIKVDPVFGCWIWQSKLDPDGYGYFGRGWRRAHLVVYESIMGAIPQGMEAEHECRNRACCNPAHIALVTRAENEKRKSWRYRVKIKRCRNGHSMATAIVTPQGGRLCRECAR